MVIGGGLRGIRNEISVDFMCEYQFGSHRPLRVLPRAQHIWSDTKCVPWQIKRAEIDHLRPKVTGLVDI